MFYLLTITLTFVFYQSVVEVLKECEASIQCNLIPASKKLLTAEDFSKQYKEQLKAAKVNAQAVIIQSEKEAKDKVSTDVGRADAARLIEQTNKKLKAKKSLTIK